MKKVLVLLAVLALGAPVMAKEQDDSKVRQTNIEEVIVTGIKLETGKEGALMVGLSGVLLIHEYDMKTNTWKFVRASNEEKADG